MTFGFFIRNALELVQFILVSSINEIYEHKISEASRVVSFVLALLIIILFLISVGLVQFLIICSYGLNENLHYKLSEFFRGLKVEKKSRMYVILILLRRFIFVILLVTLPSLYSGQLISILTVIQVVYLTYLLFIKPNKEIKCNVIEILCEIIFTVLLLTLISKNADSEWNTSKKMIYMIIIVFNILSIFLIVLVNIIINIIRRIRAKSNKITNKSNEIEIIVHPSPINQSTRENTPHYKLETSKQTGNHSILSNNRFMEESKFEEFKRISENRNNELHLKRRRLS